MRGADVTASLEHQSHPLSTIPHVVQIPGVESEMIEGDGVVGFQTDPERAEVQGNDSVLVRAHFSKCEVIRMFHAHVLQSTTLGQRSHHFQSHVR